MLNAVRILSCMACAAVVAGAHAADAYPTRPIRLLLPFAAGGTVDIMARPIAAKLHELLGMPVIVDNRPSAGGILAAELTVQAAPDGHTLFMASSSALFIAPAYFKKVPYDPLKDFTPISLVAQQPLLIVGNIGLPVRNVKELIAYAKSHAAKLNYGTVGLGTSNHLTGELLSRAAGIKMESIAYKGGAQGITAVIGNEIEIMITQPNTGLALREKRPRARDCHHRRQAQPELSRYRDARRSRLQGPRDHRLLHDSRTQGVAAADSPAPEYRNSPRGRQPHGQRSIEQPGHRTHLEHAGRTHGAHTERNGALAARDQGDRHQGAVRQHRQARDA